MKLYKYSILVFVFIFLFGLAFFAKSDVQGPFFTVTANPTAVDVNSTSTITVSMTETSPDGCLSESNDCYCWVKNSSPQVDWHVSHTLPLTHSFPSYTLTNTSPLTEVVNCKWTPTQTHIEESSVNIYINPPVVSFGVTPTGAQGSSASNPLPLPNSGATVAFSATNSDYCVMNNQTLGSTYSFSTGSITSNITYSVECYGPGGSNSAQATVYVGSAKPDLTASVATPTTATVNLPTTFTATISNNGNAGTGTSFSNFFQIASLPAGAGAITDLPPVSSPALAIGGTSDINTAYTFSSTGTYSVRACADKSNSSNLGTISETNENNNCGVWVDVAVNAQVPVNGVCGVRHYNCVSGNSINHSETPTSWTWRCEGI